jgi:tartrate-resistant acid phosphatase type 5
MPASACALCRSNCSFVVNTGDNFYNLGISTALGVTDPQWNASFNAIYSAPSLQIPFYGVLGNHDYGRNSSVASHSIAPQLEYTWFDPLQRWYMPSRYYNVQPASSIPIHITAIDTNPYLAYNNSASGTYYTPELLYASQPIISQAQLSFLTNSLAQAANSNAWTIVVGHHPPVSNKGKSNYNSSVTPLLGQGNVDLWFNGHDHVQTLYQNPGAPNTTFVTVGNSGKLSPTDAGTPAGQPGGIPGLLWANTVYHGFSIVTLQATTGRVDYYGVDPNNSTTSTSPYLLYSYSFMKNVKEPFLYPPPSPPSPPPS